MFIPAQSFGIASAVSPKPPIVLVSTGGDGFRGGCLLYCKIAGAEYLPIADFAYRYSFPLRSVSGRIADKLFVRAHSPAVSAPALSSVRTS